MKLSLDKITLVVAAVFKVESSRTLLNILYEVSRKLISFSFPDLDPLPFLFVIFPFSLVLIVLSVLVQAKSIYHSILPLANVCGAISIDQTSVSLPQSILPVAFIDVAVGIFKRPNSIKRILFSP
jgi:hypothetical protein